NGFENNEKISTGDDIFLMLKFKKKFPGEIKFLKSVEAAVTTNAEERSSSALNQRKRWASKTFSYGFSNITLIAVIIFLMNFLVLMSGIVSVINIKFVFALMTSFSCKCIVDFMLLHSASSFFKKRANPVAFFLASAIYPVYVSAIGLVAPFTKYSWKGRKL
ncbi:MAG TPA: glycosyl transferase, partial [Bacteroidia bacterium]